MAAAMSGDLRGEIRAAGRPVEEKALAARALDDGAGLAVEAGLLFLLQAGLSCRGDGGLVGGLVGGALGAVVATEERVEITCVMASSHRARAPGAPRGT
jgi:hypothetical protein